MVMKKSDAKQRTLSVSEFKSKALGLFEEIARSGEPVVVTKRGKPLVKVVPLETEEPMKGFPLGQMRDLVLHEGDIVTPFGEEIWSAAQDGPSVDEFDGKIGALTESEDD